MVQVAAWLDQLVEPTPVDPELIEQLRAQLDAVAAAATSGLPSEVLPLRLPKSRLADLDRCERTALARFRARSTDGPSSDAALRGVAVDRFVAHQLVAGRVLDPVESLTSMLAAEAEWSPLARLDELSEHEAAQLIDPLATLVAEGWSGIAAQWEPRAQSRAMVVLGDGAVVCSSVVDVELGGPSTTLPSVVVEVKSGRPAAAHQSEAYLYGLLVALRDRVAPIEVARWYPGSDIAAVPVSAGLLESAAVRVQDGIRRWAQLVDGRPPAESPGVWCRWCPEAEACPSAEPTAGASGATRTAPAAGPTTQDATALAGAVVDSSGFGDLDDDPDDDLGPEWTG